jgi:hypothetical protein
MEYLQRFNGMKWEYRPGRTNVADPLSRVHDAVLAVLAGSLVGSDLGTLIREGYAGDPWLKTPKAARLQIKKRKGFWYLGTQIVVPNVPELRTKILKEFHDTPFSGHRGAVRTQEAIARTFWWPGLHTDTQHYVANCPACQRNKPLNTKPGGLLQPLPTPMEVWESVSLDLITQLPTTKSGHDAIVVFVDRLSKMTHFAATHTSASAEDLAQLFVSTVFKQHGLPKGLVSDRDPRFTSKFWREGTRLLGTQLYMSTAFHPQTDGQTERMNRLLEETLRHYIGPSHDDWDSHLSLIEFAINNSRQESIGTTLFMLNGGRQPRTPADLHLPSNVPRATSFEADLRERLARAKACLEAAQARQKANADGRRKAVTFTLGQEVLLNTKNITFKTPGTRKLMPRYIGPFRIEKLVGPVAAKLSLPPELRIHPVFHVSLIRPYKSDGRTPPPPAFTLDGEDYWTVESIVDHKEVPIGRNRYRREYFVKWQGYPATDNSWEPEESLKASAPVEQALEAYETGLPVERRKTTVHARPAPDPTPTTRPKRPTETNPPPPKAKRPNRRR